MSSLLGRLLKRLIAVQVVQTPEPVTQRDSSLEACVKQALDMLRQRELSPVQMQAILVLHKDLLENDDVFTLLHQKHARNLYHQVSVLNRTNRGLQLLELSLRMNRSTQAIPVLMILGERGLTQLPEPPSE